MNKQKINGMASVLGVDTKQKGPDQHNFLFFIQFAWTYFHFKS